MANPQYSLSVTEGTELQLSLLGPQGPQGAPGPNTVTTSTTTTITGLLKGNGSTVLEATVGTDYQAPLVSGTNIKTVNGGSLLGSGDIDTDPVAQTWSGDNPNIPETLVVSSITGNDSIDQLPLSRRADENGRPAWGDVTFTYVRWDTGLWEAFASTEPADEFIGSEASTALTPVGLVFDSPSTGSGSITFTGDNPTGDYLGQLLQASDDSWWRWNGTSWDADVPDMADAVGTLAIANGGTGASSASTALVNLGVTGTGVQSALAAATNATGGLVTFGGNIGAATGTSLKIPTIICDSGLLEIKDSTTWQNLRIYSTTDNGSNFEYFTIAQSGAAWKISGVRSGTGPTRQLQIQPSGTLQLGANGGDGWTINTSKHLYPDGTTQSRDLGLVGNRIRTLYGQNADLTGNLTASGTVTANTLSVTDTSTTLTNLGGGTAGKAIFGAVDYSGVGSVRKLAGLDTDDAVSFSSVSASSAGATNTLAGVTVIGTSGSIQPSSDTARSVGTAARRFGSVHAVTGNFSNLVTIGYIEGTEMTAPAVPAANGYRIYAEDNGSGKTRLMVQFATGAPQQIAIEP